jgi:hypothetical protein
MTKVRLLTAFIALSLVVFVACEKKQQDQTDVQMNADTNQVEDNRTTGEKIDEAINDTAIYAENAMNATKEATEDAINATKEAANTVVDKTKEAAQTVKEKTNEAVSEKHQELHEEQKTGK